MDIEFRTPKQIERDNKDMLVADMYLRFRKQADKRISDSRIFEVMAGLAECPLKSQYGVRAACIRKNAYTPSK